MPGSPFQAGDEQLCQGLAGHALCLPTAELEHMLPAIQEGQRSSHGICRQGTCDLPAAQASYAASALLHQLAQQLMQVDLARRCLPPCCLQPARQPLNSQEQPAMQCAPAASAAALLPSLHILSHDSQQAEAR